RSTFGGFAKGKPEKTLPGPVRRRAGSNTPGRITVRHRGGGHKRKYRVIDWRRDKLDVSATVIAIEYDPNRSARIALLQYQDGEKRYIVAPTGLKVGATVMSGPNAELSTGNALPLKNIPTGTTI